MINLYLTNVCVSSHSYRHDWCLYRILSFFSSLSLSSLSVLTYSFFLQLVTFLYFISTVLRLCVCDMFLFRFLCFHLTDRPPSCIASLPFIDMVIIINAFLFLGNFVWGLDFFPLLPFVIIVGKNSSVVSCSHKSLNVHIIPPRFSSFLVTHLFVVSLHQITSSTYIEKKSPMASL